MGVDFGLHQNVPLLPESTPLMISNIELYNTNKSNVNTM